MPSRHSWDHFWQQLLAENDAEKPGWVALLLIPQGLSDANFLALQGSLASLVSAGALRPYVGLFHVAPAAFFEDVRRQITFARDQLGTDSAEIRVDAISADAESLIQHLTAAPERSVVVVHHLEIFHVAGTAHTAGMIQTWSGVEVSVATLDERYGAQVGTVVAQLLEIAKNRQLLIVTHAGLSSRAANAFDPALKSARGLRIRGGERMQDRYGALVTRLLDRVRAGTLSLERARSRARRAMHAPELRAQADAQLLFSHQRFDEAWRAIDPHLGSYANAPAAICFGVARIALAAFHLDAARVWLRRGVEAGPRAFADLRSAWQLARELDEDSLSEGLFAKFAAAYPKEPLVLQEQAIQLLRDWRYAEAADHARRAGLHFYAEVWEALATPEFDLQAILRLARHDEDRAYIHWRAALDAEHREDLDSAILLAALVPEMSEHHDRAMALRLRVFGRGVLHQVKVNDPDVDELMPLILAMATDPQKRSARMAFEDLMEETLGERAVLTLLLNACERLLPAVQSAACQAPRAVLFARNDGELAEPDEVIAFSKELTETTLKDLLVIGRGELPAAMLSRATPEMVRALLFINERMDLTGNPRQIATHRLWEIELVCRALGEPSKDCFTAIQLVRGLARQGDHQTARDFAEESLRVLPTTQPIHRLWRTGLAWMAFAEAFLWTGNPIAALRCATLMLATWQSGVREAEVACDALNLFARIYRNLNLTPLARRSLEDEKRLRTHCGAVELMWQLDALILDLEAQELRGGDRTAWLRHFASLLRVWRQLPERAERLPMLSRIISIGRHLQILGAVLPAALVQELTEALKGEGGPPALALRHALTVPPTRAEFLAIVERFDSAARKDDLKTQLSALRMLAEDTIEAAARANDADLFLATLGVLAQPVLSLTAGVPEDPLSADITYLHRHALEAIADMDREAIQDMDSVLRRAGRPRERQIAAACMVTAAQLATSLRPDETALLLAHSGRGRLCACAVNASGHVALWIAPEDSWSEVRFRRWQRRFPSGYRFAGAPGGNGWSREQLRETVRGLGLYLPMPPSRITIIPSADLFLFPFAMMAPWHPSSDVASDSFLTPAPTDSFLGVSAVISTAPSPQWLITTRAAAPSRHVERRAWIGSPNTTDQTLRELREGLRWQFQAHGIQIIEAERPTALTGASLAIVIAHGVQAEGREFRALSDGVNNFSPAEVASWLEGCACVVIAVCHGGAATAQAHSHETRGLVSAILAVGVQAVIACAWPLGSDVVRSWMPPFLQSIASGKTVDDAAFAAASQVRHHLSDAAAGVAMQIFGDGGMSVAAQIPHGN